MGVLGVPKKYLISIEKYSKYSEGLRLLPALGRCWGLLGSSWELLGGSLKSLGGSLGALGGSLGFLGESLGALGSSWGLLVAASERTRSKTLPSTSREQSSRIRTARAAGLKPVPVRRLQAIVKILRKITRVVDQTSRPVERHLFSGNEIASPDLYRTEVHLARR